MGTRQPFPYNVNVSGKYGAPMGRVDKSGDPDYSGVLHIRPVPLNQGYDKGGAYWGMRLGRVSLFCAFSPDRSIIRYFDAAGHRDADMQMREEYESALIGGVR